MRLLCELFHFDETGGRFSAFQGFHFDVIRVVRKATVWGRESLGKTLQGLDILSLIK